MNDLPGGQRKPDRGFFAVTSKLVGWIIRQLKWLGGVLRATGAFIRQSKLILITLKVIGAGIASIALLSMALYINGIAQYSHQAIVAFDASGAVSAAFVETFDQEAIARQDALSESQEAVKKAAEDAEKMAALLGVARKKLDASKSEFKRIVTDFLISGASVPRDKVSSGLEFADVYSNYTLLLEACRNKTAGDCASGDGVNFRTAYGEIVLAQREVNNLETDYKTLKDNLDTKSTALIASRTAAETAEATKNAQRRSILALWDQYGGECSVLLKDKSHFSACNTMTTLNMLLAVLMGAVGGMTLSWLQILDEKEARALIVFLNPAIGAVAGFLGLSVIVVGAVILPQPVLSTAAANADPKIVVALSLLLGIGGAKSIDIFVSLGSFVHDRLAPAKPQPESQ